MPLPEDPSIPAAEGGGRRSKRHFSSPDFIGQGGGREGLLVKTQERTPPCLAISILAALGIQSSSMAAQKLGVGCGWGPAKQNQSVAPKPGLP